MKKQIITVFALSISRLILSQQDSIKTAQISEVKITVAAKKYAEKKSEDVAKLALKNLENSQVYTILPKELMAEQLVTDYQAALQRVPGLANITYGPGSGGIGLAAYSRGFSTYAGSIRNGTATNYVTLTDPFNTESLEVIKGPSATLYGSTLISYGGLINKVTKKPYAKFGGEISYTTGQWNSNRMTADFNIPISEKLNSRINLLYQKDGTFQDYGKSNAFGISPSFSYQINDRLTIDLDAEIYQTNRNSTFIGIGKGNFDGKYLSNLKIDPSYSYASNDILSHIQSFNIFAKATYKISNQWKSQTLFSVANSENEANYLFLRINADNTITRNYMKIPSSFDAQNFQQNFTGDFLLGKMRNRLLVGFDYARNSSNDTRYRIFPFDDVKINESPSYISEHLYNQKMPTNPFYASKKDWRTTGIYATNVLDILDNLSVMASLRVDLYHDKSKNGLPEVAKQEDFKQTALAPKFGIVYQPIKNILSVFANYQTGFRNVASQILPTTNEVIKFKPEYAEQLEAGIKAELLNKRLAATLSYYDIAVNNIVRPDPVNPINSIQDGKRLSRGLEADIITSPINGWELILGYGYNDSKYVKAAANVEGRRPQGIPRHVANFWTSYRLQQGNLKGFGFGIGGNFQSDMHFSDGSNLMADGFRKFDSSIFYENTKYRIGLKLNNITNEQYFMIDYWGQFQNPRQFLVNFTLNF
ncbi:TonB-dependent receptor [Riemerella anatipestifer]|nr:TonB-dependent receptor [Riemerella anatipestifer]